MTATAFLLVRSPHELPTTLFESESVHHRLPVNNRITVTLFEPINRETESRTPVGQTACKLSFILSAVIIISLVLAGMGLLALSIMAPCLLSGIIVEFVLGVIITTLLLNMISDLIRIFKKPSHSHRV